MTRVFSTLRSTTIFCLAAILALGLLAPACQAKKPKPQSDKHARKIQHEIAKFKPGTYLDFEFRDGSQTYGALGQYTDSSFQFTDADSNKVVSHDYADVSSVKKAKEYIGEGSVKRHHHILVPTLIAAGAIAAGAASYAALR